jgi:hypothetical protein
MEFEPLGIVLVETVGSRRYGYGNTYDALIKEAAQKGADAIINVNISPTSGFFTKTWSGSALAIKYLDTVAAGETFILGGIDSSAFLGARRRQASWRQGF